MAKKSWKELEGQFFRIDVGSTQAEALASEESNVLYITTDKCIVMNGEVVGRGDATTAVKPGTGDSSGSSSGSSSSTEEESYIRFMVNSGLIPRPASSTINCSITVDGTATSVIGKYGIVKVSPDKSIFITNPFGEISAIDLSHWRPKNLERITGLFTNMIYLNSLDLSHIDISKVSSLQNMFKGLTELKYLNISTWDTRNVNNFRDMFTGCGVECLNLLSFNLSKCSNPFELTNPNIKSLYLGRDFFNAPNMSKITLNLKNWTDSSVNKSLNSLLYNRKGNSQPYLTLTLSEETKAVLSDTAKKRLESYGYTLA